MNHIREVASPTCAETRPPRHQVEEFVWADSSWDIARFWRDIDAKRVSPKLDTLDAAFIDSYATRVLLVDKSLKPGVPQRMSFLMQVDVERARALPEAALEVPLVLMRTRRGKGLLSLSDEGACYVLADGNHRVAKAHLVGKVSLKAYVLSPKESKEYLLR